MESPDPRVQGGLWSPSPRGEACRYPGRNREPRGRSRLTSRREPSHDQEKTRMILRPRNTAWTSFGAATGPVLATMLGIPGWCNPGEGTVQVSPDTRARLSPRVPVAAKRLGKRVREAQPRRPRGSVPPGSGGPGGLRRGEPPSPLPRDADRARETHRHRALVTASPRREEPSRRNPQAVA